MAMQKKYTPEEMKIMEENADKAITTMTVGAVGIGFAPVFVDVTALMIGLGVGVVAIGKCYDLKLTKDDAGDLIKQFFKAAGLTYSMIFAGQKITTSLLKSNPVSYIPSMIADAAMCGSIAFAVGSTSKRYFQRLAEGKKVTASDMKKWMKEGKETGKDVAKNMAKDKAKEFEESSESDK